MALFLPRRWRRLPSSPVELSCWGGLVPTVWTATTPTLQLGAYRGAVPMAIGRSAAATGSSIYFDGTQVSSSYLQDILGGKTSATWVFAATPITLPTGTTEERLVSAWDTATGPEFHSWFVDWYGGNIGLGIYGTDENIEARYGAGTGLVQNGQPVFAALTWNVARSGDDRHRVWIHGRQAAITAWYAPTPISNSISVHTNNNCYFGIDGTGATAKANATHLHLFSMFDKDIGDNRAQELSANPFLLLAPQRNVLYFLGTAGGAGPYTITAAQGSYTFTGNAATLTKQSKLTADQQSYTLTGNATNLLKTFILTATQQTFTLSGIDAGLFHGQALITSTGSFTLSGNDVIFNRGVMLPASSGSFTLTGNATSLLKTYVLALSSGTFTFTGNDATLTHSLATNKTLIADVGTFTLTGNDVTFPYNQVLAAGTGSFTETGNDANLLVGKKLSTTTGNFIFTGNDTGLAQSYIFSVDKGTFVLTGRNVNLWYPTAPAGTPLEILKLSTAQYMGVSEPNISVVDAGGGTYTVTVNSGESMSKIDSVHYEGYKVNSGTELGS